MATSTLDTQIDGIIAKLNAAKASQPDRKNVTAILNEALVLLATAITTAHGGEEGGETPHP